MRPCLQVLTPVYDKKLLKRRALTSVPWLPEDNTGCVHSYIVMAAISSTHSQAYVGSLIRLLVNRQDLMRACLLWA